MQYLWIAEDMLYHSIPIFIALAVFGMYSATPGNYLTADVAFPTIWLLYMLHIPMMALPQAVTSLVSARVSLRRVQELADAEVATGVPLNSIMLSKMDKISSLLTYDGIGHSALHAFESNCSMLSGRDALLRASLQC